MRIPVDTPEPQPHIIVIYRNQSLVLTSWPWSFIRFVQSERVLTKVVQPAANQIAVVPDGIVEVGEPNMEPLATEEQCAEYQAAKPGETVDCRVHNQWVAQHRENTPCKDIWNTQCSEELGDDRRYDFMQDP